MRHFYDDLIKVSRLKTISGNKMGFIATATAESSIQPLGKEGGELSEGVFGTTYICYVDSDVPVQKGDRVRDQNGTIYSVTDVILREWGAFPYKEIIVKKTS